jgi:translation elongation factor EF-1alpha
MRQQRSDAGIPRLDLRQRNLSATRTQNLLKKINNMAKKAKYHPEYRWYLEEYKVKIQKGFTMEKVLTKNEYQNIQLQAERQGGRLSVKEAVQG